MLLTQLTQSICAMAMVLGSQASSTLKRQANCSSPHVFVARGTNEASPLGGQLQKIVDGLTDQLGASVEGIDYPATLQDYQGSVRNGTGASQNQIASYAADCPDTKLVLLGYSQGAQVTGDSLCGGNAADAGPVSPPLAANLSKRVSAVMLYGDPRYVPGKTFDRGSAADGTKAGKYPRDQVDQSCDKYYKLIRSYCFKEDPICAQGGKFAYHTKYTGTFDDDALKFIKHMLDA